MRWRGSRISGFFIGLCLTGLLGCVTPRSYVERHEIKNLTVVFLDEASLQDHWKALTGTEVVRFVPHMAHTTATVRTLRGFYDPISNTLYCPKWSFEVCGHELHHAVLGQFHSRED